MIRNEEDLNASIDRIKLLLIDLVERVSDIIKTTRLSDQEVWIEYVEKYLSDMAEMERILKEKK